MKSYKIITLGASGSGKSVFIASLFHKLSIQASDTGFFLEAQSAEQRRELNARYETIANETAWPPPTKELIEWTFTCAVKRRDPYEVLQFTYLDYPGEWITDPGKLPPSAEEKLKGNIKGADALLGILDGQKILALMKQNRSAKDQKLVDAFRQELINVLQIMQGSACSIHFVITKWDIIKQASLNTRVVDVRDRLLQEPLFSDFVRQHIPDYTIRLIPVGSVGTKGFAIVQPDGTVKKNLDQEPEPWQVHLPLVCVLPDHFEAELKKLYQMEDGLSKSRNGPQLKLALWRKLRKSTGLLAYPTEAAFRWAYTSVFHKAPDFEGAILIPLLQDLERRTRSKEENLQKHVEALKQAREDSLKKVASARTALKHAVDTFLSLRDQLESEHPGSNLKTLLTEPSP